MVSLTHIAGGTGKKEETNMKQRAFALGLALCMVLAVLPAPAAAAQVLGLPEPVAAPMALPELTQPTAKTYSIEMTYSGHGYAELYSTSAGARESVYFLADPEPGYGVSFAKCGYYKDQYDMRLLYIGANVYEIIMPDGDVKLDLQFVKLETEGHDVTVTVSEGGMASVDQQSAKKGESLFVEVIPTPGYTLTSVKARSGGKWLEGYYLGKVEGAELYEVFMPDADVEILVDFTRNGPYAITPYVDSEGGTIELSHETAYELETVTVTAVPERGWRTASVSCYLSQVTQVSENVYTFSMPKFKEEVHATFEKIVYPVSVTMELAMGGTALLDAEGAVIGQTVTLTCVPDEGYRVARITGAELTDNGDNTYTFVMEDAAVELSVLFLRENNPFLDVNETHFFHDPVLWAVENSITKGVDDTHFGPGGACSRAQVVTFLWRAAGSPVPETEENPFTDVAEGIYYSDAVLWAVEKGITTGTSETTFGPGSVCNRAQVVTFLWRANGSPEPETEEDPFADVEADSWYEPAILWALENGVTAGTSDTTFGPGSQCIRAQVVTFLYRAAQIPEPEPEPLPFPDIT